MQLLHQPTVVGRNRKPLQPNPLARFELRIGELRVYYEVDEGRRAVEIWAVGIEDRDRVLIGREEIDGKPVATVTAVPQGADWGSLALSMHPKFLAIMERSRRAHRERGGISPDEMRRHFGIRPKGKARRKPKP